MKSDVKDSHNVLFYDHHYKDNRSFEKNYVSWKFENIRSHMSVPRFE